MWRPLGADRPPVQENLGKWLEERENTTLPKSSVSESLPPKSICHNCPHLHKNTLLLFQNAPTDSFPPFSHNSHARSACKESTSSHHPIRTPLLALVFPPQRCHVAQDIVVQPPNSIQPGLLSHIDPRTSVEDCPSTLDSPLPTLPSSNYWCLFHVVFPYWANATVGRRGLGSEWTRLSAQHRPMRNHQVTLQPYLIQRHLPLCHSSPRATRPDQRAPAPRSNLRPFPENLSMAQEFQKDC